MFGKFDEIFNSRRSKESAFPYQARDFWKLFEDFLHNSMLCLHSNLLTDIDMEKKEKKIVFTSAFDKTIWEYSFNFFFNRSGEC